MELDIEIKQQLTNLLAKPELISDSHVGLLTDLVKAYPYYQPLHLLLAKASGSDKLLTTASLYNGGNLTYRYISNVPVQRPFVAVTDEQEVFEEIAEVQQNSFNDAPIVERHDLGVQNQEAGDDEVFEEIAEVDKTSFNDAPVLERQDLAVQNQEAEDDEVFEEIAEVNKTSFNDSATIERQDLGVQNLQGEDDDEVFEEIAEVDLVTFKDQETEAEEIKVATEQTSLPDELALESIVSADFFAFEKNFNTEAVVSNAVDVSQPEEYSQEAEAQSTVSKYDDDKLPYSFLWWLAKTRKEHEQIFQPYVTPKQQMPGTVAQGDLQHQYVEHIFHLQTPFNLADEAKKGPLNLQNRPKGLAIIDSFIKNDPQIKAPKPEQINTENKAKKSAEDNYDLVSETLATIYIEQTLYHKAIDTYEKLSLKFPEKSRYFADLIQSLEKKI